MADLRIPISPIHGMVNTTGDASHRPFIQLKNPSASGFILRVYELKIGGTTAAERWRLRRTNSPVALGGTETTAALSRRDETDTTSIVAILKGCTAVATNPPFAESDAFWYDRITKDSDQGYQQSSIIIPLSYPITVKQGSAIEFCGDTNSATINIRLYACWDEIAV